MNKTQIANCPIEVFDYIPRVGYREEWEKYIGDIKVYPNSYEYTYRGITIKLSRNCMHSWCGYIYIHIPEEEIEEVREMLPEDEITYHDKDCIGFDHAHFDDYVPGEQCFIRNSEFPKKYWTHDDAKKRLEEILDIYLDQIKDQQSLWSSVYQSITSIFSSDE